MTIITDPQSQSSYDQADPNANAVENTPVGGQEDNQRVLARQTPSGTSRGVQQLGGPSLQADSGNKQITVTDLVPQVLMGSQPNFGEGFFVTKPGIDVTLANDVGDFVFNSNQDVFKIVEKQTDNITNDGSPITINQIRHGLNFIPIVQGFLNNESLTVGGSTTLSIPLPTWTGASIDTIKGTATNSGNPIPIVAFSSYLNIMTDNTFVQTVLLNASGVPLNFVVTFYLLQETATKS